MKRPRFRAPRLFQKLLVSYICVALFVVVLAAAISYNLIIDFIKSDAIDELNAQAEVMAKYPDELYEFPRAGYFTDIQRDLFVIVESREGEYVARRLALQSGAWQTRRLIEQVDTALMDRSFAGEGAFGVGEFEFLGAQTAYVITPLYSETGEVASALMVYRPMREISYMAMTFTFMICLGGALAVAMAGLVAWRMSGRFAAPIAEMRAKAAMMASGDLSARVNVRQSDELGELGESFNDLSEQLSELIDNLQAEKRKLELILRDMGEGLVAMDALNAPMHANQTALELLEIEDVSKIGMTPLSEATDACLESGCKRVITWKNPSGRDIEASVAAIGCDVGAVAIIRDVSESARLEQLRRDYIANISHELRTPLTGIRGMVEPLIDGIAETDEERANSYRVIFEETLRLQRLIGEMLDLSRLQGCVAEMEIEKICASGVIRACAERTRARAQSAGITLALPGEGSDVWVMGNENRVMQVLIIFLDNAISFTRPGGRIEVGAEIIGASARIGVRDTGSGIEARDLPYIWERFYKADRSRSGGGGTGLGLAIAKLAVERMGGEIGVQTRLGEGSYFYFDLPTAGIDGD